MVHWANAAGGALLAFMGAVAGVWLASRGRL